MNCGTPPRGRQWRGIAPGNATTGTIAFPLTAAWGGLEKTEEGKCHERKQILGQEPGPSAGRRKRGRFLAGTLTATDRCDRCGAQAYVRVLLPGRLELLFCAHHHRQYADALTKIAVEIRDETHRLARVAA